MNIAVTGASGYVGGILCRGIDAAGHHVLAWSRRPCPGDWNHYEIKDKPSGLPWPRVEALVHAAYDFGTGTLKEALSANVIPSIRLLKTANDHGVKHLVFISSISSFEGTRSAYGRAKLAIEKECLAMGGTVIRPGLVWGNHPGGVMGAMERVVKSLPIIPCLTGPQGLRQYLVHEEDLCTAVLDAAIAPPNPTGRLIEATNPDPLALKQILNLIARRHHLRRSFLPFPWQFAMAALRAAETFGIKPPFRSDSLTGLVHGVSSLQSNSGQLRERYRPFD